MPLKPGDMRPVMMNPVEAGGPSRMEIGLALVAAFVLLAAIAATLAAAIAT